MKTCRNNPMKLTRKSRAAQFVYAALNSLPFLTKSKRYSITISDAERFVWYRVAKVGTRTIYNTLRQSNINLSVEHAYGAYVPAGQFEGYFKFAFVRNPFDRLVSCWLNKVVGRDKGVLGVDDATWSLIQSFSGFVSYVETLNLNTCNIHLRKQSSLIDLSVIDYIGRMESFAEDTKEVFKIIGVNVASLESRNTTKSRVSYKDYYSESDVKRVYELYKKDCQIFGYTF